MNATAADIADAIEAAYSLFRERFAEITARAHRRFEAREWRSGQWDAAERLMLYKISVDRTVERLRPLLLASEPELAAGLKDAYSQRIAELLDCEIAETFFNSVVRRLFGTVGLNPALEFFDTVAERTTSAGRPPAFRSYPARELTVELFGAVLKDAHLRPAFRDLPGDSRQVAERVREELARSHPGETPQAIEVLPSLFFRNKAGYLIGRVRLADGTVPLILPLLHRRGGIMVDAVLTSSEDASGVFGFTRSYFHVETDHPRAVVDFLREIMPLKRIDELYIAIGYHKHGKRELFRELQQHLADPGARFEFAEGKRGLVMIVFTLPSFNVVFKVIRNAFGPTKETSRRAVKEKYRMVFLHDRVGRLADAQEFELLEFRRRCFAPALLEELMREASESIRLRDEAIVVQHLYTERRVTPLDLFLQDADGDAAHDAISEYGHAIRDLAAANIFPGDMLLKNFGVTRHGRVIFYDYDELRLLTECTFRRLPEPRDAHDEYAAEPFFHVAEGDVFPEEFLPFLIAAGPLRDAFLEEHAELLDVAFWKRMQERQVAGEVIDFFPYPPARRLHRG